MTSCDCDLRYGLNGLSICGFVNSGGSSMTCARVEVGTVAGGGGKSIPLETLFDGGGLR